MEQKFSNNSIDLQVLCEFCEREGEVVAYRTDFHPRHPISGLCRGLFCAVFRNFAKHN